MKRTLIVIIALAALAVAACSSPAPTLPPLPTLPPGATAAPSTEPVAPVVTTTPLPVTATAAPTATPASDAVPCPLTDLPVSQAVLQSRRPLLVQIGNSGPERPQFGLAQADLVFETIAEGGITRFSALYLCQDATDIAGVRSGRLIDLQLLPIFDAIFVHVGASEQVQALFENDRHIRDASLDFFRDHPGFTLQPDRRRAPFDVFTSTAALYEAARQRAIPVPGDRPVPQLNFADAPPAGGTPVASVTVRHHSSYWVRWKWDTAADAWRRLLTNETSPANDTPYVDAATGRALTAANVLIIQAPHEQTDIIEDSLNSHSVQVNLIGSGAATLLRDGQLFTGAWKRNALTNWFTLTLADGSPMTLRPGNTFVHFYPTTFKLDVAQP